MTWKPDIFIYHSPCDDGFAAAWAVRQRWGTEVELFPTNYGRKPPEIAGKNVLIGDFSYKYETLCAMSFEARSIVVLDHHKTAKADLERLPMMRDLSDEARDECFKINWTQNTPEIAVHFDMEKSGAMLTWEFCNPGKAPPMLIHYVQDRDLWKFDYEETRAISLWLRSHAYDFALWDELSAELENKETYAIVLREARGIERFYNQKIAEMTREMHWIRVDGHTVPAVNCSWAFASDVAHELLDMGPCPFAACYYDRAQGVRSYSLRSRDDRMDVSAIAKRYGGDGHRNAAGFEVPI